MSHNLGVAELKQIEPNADDKRFTDELWKNGHASKRRNPNWTARRVRNQLNTSSAQIKSYLDHKPGTPAILVLFDNSDNGYDDPDVVQTAMYGYEQVEIAPAGNGNAATVIEQGFAPRNDAEIRCANRPQRLTLSPFSAAV